MKKLLIFLCCIFLSLNLCACKTTKINSNQMQVNVPSSFKANINLVYKSYIVMFLFIPILVGFIVNVNGDNVLDTIKILFKFYINKKIYIKDYENIIIFFKNKDKKIL